MRIGPGVTPPRLIHKTEPEYSPEARADHVQGTVILQIVVNEKGRATDISVISPLGFGFDEQAQTAVAKWEFVPGMKAGRSEDIPAPAPGRTPRECIQPSGSPCALASLRTLAPCPPAMSAAARLQLQSRLSRGGSLVSVYVFGKFRSGGEGGIRTPGTAFDRTTV
jgi:TonB family protein